MTQLITIDRATLDQIVVALEDSIDCVRHEYETYWGHGLPKRKAQIDSMKESLDRHEASITAGRAALANAEPIAKLFGTLPVYDTPEPQAQDKSDNYLSGYCTGRTDLLKEQSAQPAQGVPEVGFGNMQSAQPVAQPLPDPCHTCAHYQQGKLPGVRIHDETCYECRSYWGNKWEAA